MKTDRICKRSWTLIWTTLAIVLTILAIYFPFKVAYSGLELQYLESGRCVNIVTTDIVIQNNGVGVAYNLCAERAWDDKLVLTDNDGILFAKLIGFGIIALMVSGCMMWGIWSARNYLLGG